MVGLYRCLNPAKGWIYPLREPLLSRIAWMIRVTRCRRVVIVQSHHSQGGVLVMPKSLTHNRHKFWSATSWRLHVSQICASKCGGKSLAVLATTVLSIREISTYYSMTWAKLLTNLWSYYTLWNPARYLSPSSHNTSQAQGEKQNPVVYDVCFFF